MTNKNEFVCTMSEKLGLWKTAVVYGWQGRQLYAWENNALGHTNLYSSKITNVFSGCALTIKTELDQWDKNTIVQFDWYNANVAFGWIDRRIKLLLIKFIRVHKLRDMLDHGLLLLSSLLSYVVLLCRFCGPGLCLNCGEVIDGHQISRAMHLSEI